MFLSGKYTNLGGFGDLFWNVFGSTQNEHNFVGIREFLGFEQLSGDQINYSLYFEFGRLFSSFLFVLI